MPVASTAESPLRQSLQALLSETISTSSPELGYTLQSITFAEAVEVSLAKLGVTFVLWLKPVADKTSCFKSTERFKIGHRFEPPDRLGYTLLTRVCTRLGAWERALTEGAERELFRGTSVLVPRVSDHSGLDPAVVAALSQASFSPIYDDWLEERDRQLTARIEALTIGGKRNLLLVNATKGLQFYPSLVDFFARLQGIHPSVQVTAASYFDGIFQFQAEVARKGLNLVTVEEVMQWDSAALNRFDAVLMIGPSDLMARFMCLKGLNTKLVLLDLGFYHQLIEAYPTAFYEDGELIRNRSAQINQVAGYSCQQLAKLDNDFRRVCPPGLIQWRWFNYIPVGFAYCRYHRSDQHAFDVALLGSAGRDYALIDHELFRGVRFLFIGSPDQSPEIDRLRSKLDVTIASGVDQETYTQLLALARCVVLPLPLDVRNVFLSLLDAVAAGRPLVTSRHSGISRMESGFPAVFYDETAADLFAKTRDLLHENGRLQDVSARSVGFTKEYLDIYRIAWTMLEEQILYY